MNRFFIYFKALVFSLAFFAYASDAQTNLKVVSYNTHGGHGNLGENLANFKDLLDGDEQVLCLQELNPDIWQEVQDAFPEFPYTYPVWQRTTDFIWPWQTREWSGGAILSKLPILEQKEALIQIDPGGDLWERKAAFVKLQSDGDPDHVYVAHYHNTYNWNIDDFASEREGMEKFRDFVIEELGTNSLNVTEPYYVLAGDFNLFNAKVNEVLFDTAYHYGNGRDHQNSNIFMLDTQFIPTVALDISDHNAVTVTYDFDIHPVVTEDEEYYLQNRFSGLYMEVMPSDASTQKQNVQQGTYRGDNRQRFRFSEVGNGVYSITSVYSERSLDVSGNSQENGANVLQWNYGGKNNQKFSLSRVADSYYKISPQHSNKLIEVGGRSKVEGGNIQQWQDVSQLSAHWQIIPVE